MNVAEVKSREISSLVEKKKQIKLVTHNSKRRCTQHTGVFTFGLVWFFFFFYLNKGVYPVTACMILPC